MLLLRQHHDEALALLIAGLRRGAQAFGLGSALASAMLVSPNPDRDMHKGCI
ncbi:hypothetical protein ACFY05_00010 [Microtetraspora fusca]|uniref:Uncharacterized protein n=1 Tax=Microtetraspora fusca TaxID=1997 RepID=A0ABW6UZW9_MICFU